MDLASQNISNIIEDVDLPMDHWRAYFLYQEFQKDYFKRCSKLLKFSETVKKILNYLQIIKEMKRFKEK
jgi:hypothetical protein